jgi:hypothetical protein
VAAMEAILFRRFLLRMIKVLKRLRTLCQWEGPGTYVLRDSDLMLTNKDSGINPGLAAHKWLVTSL